MPRFEVLADGQGECWSFRGSRWIGRHVCSSRPRPEEWTFSFRCTFFSHFEVLFSSLIG